MKNVFMLAALASFSILVADAAQAKDIRKQNQFLEAVAGKKLVSGGTWLVVSADGKIEGNSSKHGKIVGAWVWNKRYFCRNVFIGQNQLPEDCQKVTIEGDQITFTREKGKGDTSTMTISN